MTTSATGNKRRGGALIDVLLAVTLLTIGLVPILRVLGQSLRAVSAAEDGIAVMHFLDERAAAFASGTLTPETLPGPATPATVRLAGKSYRWLVEESENRAAGMMEYRFVARRADGSRAWRLVTGRPLAAGD